MASLSERFRQWWSGASARQLVLVAVAALAVFGLALLAGAWTFACAGSRCPSTAGLAEHDPDQTSKVYAADGRLITELGLERRTVVPLAEMSPAVTAAFLATEDKRFYRHNGVDWFRVLGAVKNNLLAMEFAEGFSTITMQLAGNLWPEDINRRDRSIGRKLREAKVARAIERRYDKDKILELYLNQIDLGNRAFGVEAASQRYFGKSVRELNVAEAAVLAALPKAPSYYNPRRYPQRALRRRNLVISLMAEAGYLGGDEAERWKAYPLRMSSRSDFSGVAQYFVEYVRQQLEARFGTDLYRSGYRIYTTIDLDIQQAAERALEAQLQTIEAGKEYGRFPHRTYQQYLDSLHEDTDRTDQTGRSPYLQGLVVTLDARTGAIRAMVGGRDFDDSKFNRAVQARRQAGSTFKPIVYSAALRAGVPLSHMLVDEPISIEAVPGEPPWEPKNYDLTFEGPMTLRRALYRSQNIPAIKLGMEVGEQAVIAEAIRFGLTATRIPAVPSIFIGAVDVSPLEMIASFTAFATNGVRAVPNAVMRVEDRSGRILWEPEVRHEMVMDADQTWLIRDVLRDVVRRGTATRAITAAGFTVPSGGKTGTTNDYKDVWFIGFTPDLVTGVWVGFDQPVRIMNNAQGGRLAAPAWSRLMKEVYERRPSPAEWTRPDGLVFDEIDATTGYRAGPFCPTDVRQVEWFLPNTAPIEVCPVHSPFLGAGGSALPPVN
jgi:penicillin-binding protein 1A